MVVYVVTEYVRSQGFHSVDSVWSSRDDASVRAAAQRERFGTDVRYEVYGKTVDSER